MRASESRLSKRRLFPTAVGIASFAIGAPFALDAEALPVATHCQVDVRGANDRPGQRDVTKFCVDTGAGAPWEMHLVLSLDDTSVSGANTIDGCLLFNADGDAFVDLAVCVTLGSSGPDNGNLTELRAVRLFTCNDAKANKCMAPVEIGGARQTVCEVGHPDGDPFSPAAEDGPGDDYPYDSQVVCAVDLDDFGISGVAPVLMDTCSYPSMIPNSDDDDCILYAGCTTAAECDDGNACSSDACDPSGVCIHAPDPAAACSDDLFCNGPDECNTLGFCESAGQPTNCDDGIPCTIDACDEYTDLCINDPRDTLCDDGAWCNGVEICDGTLGCRPGDAVDCADAAACTADACDEARDTCTHEPTPGACDDSMYCNGTEVCDAVAGCMAGAPPVCDDGISCTRDACDEVLDACSVTVDDGACSDGLFCDGEERCDPVSGCIPGPPPDCDDGVGCTWDSCSETADLCEHDPDHALCDDGEFCNGVETCDPVADCQVGVEPCEPPLACEQDRCVGCVSDADCDNGLFCDGIETCDLATGACFPATPVECDDGVACTLDACDENVDACLNVPSDPICNDGQFCNGVETCDPSGGCEAGETPACDDGIDCTADPCDEESDRCGHVADDSACSDGRFCNGEEVCTSYGCEDGEEVTCRPDPFDCSIERCDDLQGRCVSDLSRCVCGDFEVTGIEDCEPPARAGTFEDCNNGMDDNGNDLADCADPECAHGSGRGDICDESCRIDRPCARVAEDPATIAFEHGDRPDKLQMHGRFPVDVFPDPLAEGVDIEISNDLQPIYVASLGPGDFEVNPEDDQRFRFVDRDARFLGASSSRGGLRLVTLAFREIDGATWIAFVVRAYGDFSAANHRQMSTQIAVGGGIGVLNAEWSARRGRWVLKLRDFRGRRSPQHVP